MSVIKGTIYFNSEYFGEATFAIEELFSTLLVGAKVDDKEYIFNSDLIDLIVLNEESKKVVFDFWKKLKLPDFNAEAEHVELQCDSLENVRVSSIALKSQLPFILMEEKDKTLLLVNKLGIISMEMSNKPVVIK